jgi:hypothetical protein
VGTNRFGKVVVVYPQCQTDAVQSCDLVAYQPGASKPGAAVRLRLAAASQPGVGETEGAMDHGALAFNRWTAPGTPLNQSSTKTTLLYKPVGGPVRVLTDHGGMQLALRGNQIAQVRNHQARYGECGQPTVELVTTHGTRRTVRLYRCGLNGNRPLGPAFVKGRLLWVMDSIERAAFTRYDLTTHKLAREQFTNQLMTAYAPASATTGFILTDPTSIPGTTQPVSLTRVTGLTYPLQP